MAQAVVTMNEQTQGDAQIRAFSRWTNWGGAALAFLVGALAAALLLAATPGFVSNDDYYHARLSAEIIEQGSLRVAFPVLPMTILSADKFVDHHLLYHLYVAPFAYWGGIDGAKFAQALVVGGIFAAFWLLLRTLQIRPAWLWLVALLGISTPFLYRILMVRTQGAAVLALLIALYLLFKGRYRWMMAVAFAFTWLYNGFILLPVFCGLYVAATWLTERRFVPQPLLFALIGTAAGLIVNPYFPQNIAFILEHLGEKVDVAASVRVGSEWYPYTTEALLNNSLGALLALVGGIVAPSLRKTGRDRVETMLLFAALITLYMTFESRRFIEYAPIFALLFGAAALGRGGIDWRGLLPGALQRRLILRFAPVILALPVLALVWATTREVYSEAQGAPSDYMAGAAAWLRENTEPGAMVFQTDWDDFPYLYFYNTRNTYLVGLDPTYLQVADPNLWNLWVSITQGIVERPSVLIRETFDASYVVSDTRHDAFANRAEGDPSMELVYRDANSLVWQIRALQTER